MTYSISLDIASDITLGQLDDICINYNLQISNYFPYGPAGGNPEITFSSPNFGSIVNFLLSEYTTPDNLDFYLEKIQKI